MNEIWKISLLKEINNYKLALTANMSYFVKDADGYNMEVRNQMLNQKYSISAL